MGHQVFSWLIQIKAHNSVSQGFLFHHLASSRGLSTPTISWCSAVPLCSRTLRTEGFPPWPVAQKMPPVVTDAAPFSCIPWLLPSHSQQHQGPKLPLLKVLIEISKSQPPTGAKQSHYTTFHNKFHLQSKHPFQTSPKFLGFPDWFRPFRLGDFLSPKNSNPSLWPSREIFREPCWTRTHGRRTTRIHPEFWDSLGGDRMPCEYNCVRLSHK